jgi:GTP-binding protein EngB required for normal cell division
MGLTKPDPEAEGKLNRSQRLRLRVSCQYIDQLLSEIESILHASSSRSPFGKYVADLSPAQGRVIEDYIARVRTQLLRSLAWQQIESETPTVAASHAIQTHVSFIDIAVEELRPRYMRGSGPIEEEVAAELNGVVHELRSLLEGLTHFLRQRDQSGLEERLERLRKNGADVSLLDTMAGIIARHGLVEFRERLEAVTVRLEDNRFEIAFFGRVSAGKSSLLNALMGVDVLPVGINPITAVPTRLQSGQRARAVLSFADGRRQEVPLEQLASFVTEEQNPGNARNVVKAIAEIPSMRLREGIVLVDTPGLGSLARRGARETLAYLPSADLAALLVDAGTTLQEEDIATLRLLREAGIPSFILLSKADLLDARDIERAQSYIEEQLKEQLGASPAIYAVSARAAHGALLDRFYESVLLPTFEQAELLRKESLARKTGALREAVTEAMETMLNRNRDRVRFDPNELNALETDLRLSIGKVGEQPRIFERDLLQLEEGVDRILEELSLVASHSTGEPSIASDQFAQCIQELVQARLETPIADLRRTAEAAVEAVGRIASALGSAEGPAVSEVSLLFRNLPRFEMNGLSPLKVDSMWNFLGERARMARVQSLLKQQVRAPLQQELRNYGRVLHRWVQETTHTSQRLIDSYADAYRAQIQRLAGSANVPEDSQQLRRDIVLLKPAP